MEEKPDVQTQCEHKHPCGATAWQVFDKKETEMLVKGALRVALLLSYVCPYCQKIDVKVLS